MDTYLWQNIQYTASLWLLRSLAASGHLFNLLSGLYTGIIDMWGITIEVSKLKITETKTLTSETTDAVIHISPEEKREKPLGSIIKKEYPKLSVNQQEDLDRITIDVEGEDSVQSTQDENRGKEQLIQESHHKEEKENCLPTSLFFIGAFLMFSSLVAITYWFTKN